MALINYLTRVHFADRVLEDALAEQMELLGIRRPLIVTDLPGADNEPLARVLDALPGSVDAAIQRIAAIGVHADLALAEISAQFATGQCDGYISVGGRAALTLARCAAHDCTSPARNPSAVTSGSQAQTKYVPVIAIPTTTACVGLQPILQPISQSLLAFSVHRSRCASYGQLAMLPDAILCDPTLTIEQDEFATAVTGMDALTHCIEAYLGTTWNPPADGMALDGVRRAVANLDTAVRDGANLEARREMMATALDAGLSAHKGLGAIEALSSALDGEEGPGILHGHFNAALLPVVLMFNAPAIGARLATLRDLLQLSSIDEVPKAITALGASVHLPLTLASLHMDRVAHRRVAQRAVEHPATRTNPRHANVADYVWMLEHAS